MQENTDPPQYDPYSAAQLGDAKEGSYMRLRMEYVNLRVRRLRTDGRKKPDKLLIAEAIQAFDTDYGDGAFRRVPKNKKKDLSK